MVEINIAVDPNEPAKLEQLLKHVFKEITKSEYRCEQSGRGTSDDTDTDWVYMNEGKYSWSRDDEELD